MSTDADWVTLDDGERVEWSERPLLESVLPQAASVFALALGWVVVARLLELPSLAVFAGLFVGLALAVGVVYPVYTTAYLVTDRAVYTKRGRRARRVTSVELDRVQDVSYHRSLLGGVFGYGTVTVEVAGGDEVTLSGVADAERAATLVGRLVHRADDPIPGSVEQWRAVRDELRAIRTALESGRETRR
ncbi:PH domain-containing protein [Halogeometricum limi]|uniref:PH domain-containing protein n=1 Tax=Halogeometricum limi TaxID=555875 RepID=A0A1I6GID0_9EURY|nr:PH domain-containing protein [Halogeometricum limi]SFR41936.1 PH domain-containing protein [Halogeometricum limi]